ncbi:DUF2642 domain-containing protein [Gracilibacillus oryzae]|uniref:DUF2642 domain-containing protein n=1 Tax=Gracilibacillus oryzae TaxID=1672701 RepID=A0A7C8KUT5_9BACI|nr:DUF2642 domain-containing protein [Gracilibacillus oryzae]KAB8134697.1 DUF2642 domain-containing protein [Gracilibacillus oryzae]
MNGKFPPAEKQYAPLNPIVQPGYINQVSPQAAEIYPIPLVPQPNQYVTFIDPVFVDHLSRHKNQPITVTTIMDKVEGILTGIAVDHIQINISEDRAVHIRIAQIVSFEGKPITYK